MSNKEPRMKTQSKHFYDDEIELIMPNGDIHLKMGVKRKDYNKASGDLTTEMSQINYSAYHNDKMNRKVDSFRDIDETGNELDNWE